MGKLAPYMLGNISVDLEQFRDDITNLWNLGKAVYPVVTSVPNWNAQTAEGAWYAPASGGHTLYFYFGSAWVSTLSITV